MWWLKAFRWKVGIKWISCTLCLRMMHLSGFFCRFVLMPEASLCLPLVHLLLFVKHTLHIMLSQSDTRTGQKISEKVATVHRKFLTNYSLRPLYMKDRVLEHKINEDKMSAYTFLFQWTYFDKFLLYLFPPVLSKLHPSASPGSALPFTTASTFALPPQPLALLSVGRLGNTHWNNSSFILN